MFKSTGWQATDFNQDLTKPPADSWIGGEETQLVREGLALQAILREGLRIRDYHYRNMQLANKAGLIHAAERWRLVRAVPII